MIFDDSGTPTQLQPLKPVKLGFFTRYRIAIEIVFGVLILLGFYMILIKITT